jgi:hypothetical protein
MQYQDQKVLLRGCMEFTPLPSVYLLAGECSLGGCGQEGAYVGPVFRSGQVYIWSRLLYLSPPKSVNQSTKIPFKL